MDVDQQFLMHNLALMFIEKKWVKTHHYFLFLTS
jgi:hypothetical protein